MNATYFIQRTKISRKGTCIIHLDLAWRGYRLQLSSGLRCAPENFTPDARNKKLVHSREDNSLALNWKLQQLRLDVELGYLGLEREHQRVRDITPAMVRELVSALLGRQVLPEALKPSQEPGSRAGQDIWEVFGRWRHLNRLKFSEGHLRHFLPAKKWLAIYAPHLTVEELDEEWVQSYVNWLLEHSTLRNGAIRTHLKFFRAMLKFSRLPYEWLVNTYHEHTPGVDLTYQEVQQLYAAEYFLPELRETADVYTFLCMVGLRWSDYLTLDTVTPVPTAQGEVLVILDKQQQKTRQAVTVPLNAIATEIWRKYDGRMPKVTNQEYNRRLKLMARVAKLDRLVDITTVRGIVYSTVRRPLYEVISAHTSRHSFASQLLEGSGNNLALVSEVIGHDDIKTTTIYARKKQLQSIADTLQAWDNLKNKQPNEH